MKHILSIFITTCLLVLSSNGQDCVTPAAIANGVPLIGEATCGTGVLLPDNACSANYDADTAPEEAKVYAYTTGVTAEDITIAMSNITDTWSGVSMVSGTCGDVAATCLGFYGSGSGSADGGFTAAAVPANTTVYIYVTNWPAPNCIGSYDLSLTASAAAVCGDAVCDGAETFVNCPADCPVPAGANCGKSITVVSGDTIFGAQIITGAMSQDTICNIGDDEDATWYKFTAPADGFIDVESTAGGDTYLNILSGDCANLTCLAQNDDGGAGLLSLISDLPVTAGTVYRIEWDNRYSSGANPFDFVLNFSLPPSCPNPTGLTETASFDQATISWVDNAGASNWQVQYDTTGFLLGTGNIVGSSDTTKTITGLDAETTYDYYVRANCGGGDGNSEWISGGSFTTGAAPIAVACDDTFIDSGDTLAYSINELNTYNICPDNPGDVVTLTFSFVDIEVNAFGVGSQDGCWDFLTIYDGPDANSPVLAQTLCGELDGDGGVPSDSTSLLQAGDVFMSSGGCLTVVFDSDGSVNEQGWEATVTCGGDDCSVYDTAPVDLTKSFDPVGGVQDRVQVKWFKASPEVRYTDEDAAMCDIKFWAKRNLDPVTGSPVGPAIVNPDTVLIEDAKKTYGDNSPREIFKWPVKFRSAADNPNAKRADPNIRYEWQVRCECGHSGDGPESPWSDIKIFNVPDFDPVTGIYTPPGGIISDNGDFKSITAGAELSIYPNPVSGDEINLVLNGLDDYQGMALISLRDVTGKLVYSESVAVKGNALNQQIHFENQLGEGLYMLSIEVGNTIYHDRLMVK